MLIPLIKNKIPFIDVRAPSEFILGAVPTSKNLPILSNNERTEVGKIYKESGNKAAIEKGYSLVNGITKDKRISNWIKFVNINPQAKSIAFKINVLSRCPNMSNYYIAGNVHSRQYSKTY